MVKVPFNNEPPEEVTPVERIKDTVNFPFINLKKAYEKLVLNTEFEEVAELVPSAWKFINAAFEFGETFFNIIPKIKNQFLTNTYQVTSQNLHSLYNTSQSNAVISSGVKLPKYIEILENTGMIYRRDYTTTFSVPNTSTMVVATPVLNFINVDWLKQTFTSGGVEYWGANILHGIYLLSWSNFEKVGGVALYTVDATNNEVNRFKGASIHNLHLFPSGSKTVSLAVNSTTGGLNLVVSSAPTSGDKIFGTTFNFSITRLSGALPTVHPMQT